jgi:hypothetical protein
MTHQIFRPKGLYILTNAPSPEYQRIPVLGLNFGSALFGWKGIPESIVCGLEVHGEVISLHLPLEELNGGEARVAWDSIGFNFTLFNLWVSGLSLEDKENVIDEVLSWQEEAQRHIAIEGSFAKKAA